MKKTYIQPSILLVKLASKKNFLGASDPKVGFRSGNVDAGSVGSRRGGGYNWYDDEDEDS